MALIHEMLYQSDNLEAISLKYYLEKLVSSINFSHNNGKLVSHHINCDDNNLDIDTMVPLGLVMNEIITNSFKYAFVGRESGELSVAFSGRTR